MTENNETQQVEIVQNDALGAIERAQVDVQISTARKYPRTLSAVKQRMLSFATLAHSLLQNMPMFASRWL